MLQYTAHCGGQRGYVVPMWTQRILIALCLLPYFVTTKKYLQGQNATLNCKVDLNVRGRLANRPPRTYTWTKSGKEGERILVLTYVSGIATINDSGSLSGRVQFDPPYLRIHDLQVADSGLYSCQVIGATIKTSSTKLEVNSVPAIDVKVNSSPTVEGISGLYAAATCQATEGKPPARVKWIYTETGAEQRSNDTLETLDDGSFNAKSELLLEPGLIGRFPNATDPVTARDRTKNFTCVVQHEHFEGGGERAATVAVDLLYPPIVTIWMQSNKLTCAASGNPAPFVVWTRPDGSTETGSESIFVDQGTPTASSGRYACLAENSLGTGAVSAINVRKSEDLPTLFTNTLRYNASLPLKARGYEMECTAEVEATGEPTIDEVRFLWTKDGGRIARPSPYAITQDVVAVSSEKTLVRSTLRIIEVERYRDEGLFKCRLSLPDVGSGYVRAVERSIRVKVDYPPVEGSVVARIHPRATVRERTDVTLSCTATSSPPSSYRWFFNGRAKSAGSRLVLRNVSRTEAGIYKCAAFNYVPGGAHKEARLVVHYPPGRVAIIKTETGLYCAAEGGSLPPPRYTWLLPNGTMTSGNRSTLELPTFDASSPTSYTCLVGNDLRQPSNSTFHLKEVKTGGIGLLTVGEFVATLIVTSLLLAVVVAALWIVRRREWGRKSVVARSKNEYDASKSLPDGTSAIVSPKTQGKPSLLNYVTLNSRSNLVAPPKENVVEEQPSIYRNVEVLDESGGVEIVENESIAASNQKENPDAPKTAQTTAIPNSSTRLTTFSQPETDSSIGGAQLTGPKNYFTAHNPARYKPEEPSPLHRALSENFRPGLNGEATKSNENVWTSEGRTSAAGMEGFPPPQYSTVIVDRRMAKSPQPPAAMSTPVSAWPARSTLKAGKADDFCPGSRKFSLEQPPVTSPSSQMAASIPANPYPSFRHNRVSRADSFDQFAAQEAEYRSSTVSSRSPSVDPSYVLACTPPMAELPARSYLFQSSYADGRMSLSAPKVAAFSDAAAPAVSPYDSGCDSVRSANATTAASKGRRMQSLTLV